MSNKVDVIYQNGEVVDFCWYGTNDRAQVVLHQNGENSLIFRFCRSGGKSEEILKAEDFSHAQVLLSHRDRLLAASEGNIFFEEDFQHYQILRIPRFDINTSDTRAVLNSSLWNIEPKRRGKVNGELSIAIYSQKMEYSLQLFFTVPVTVVGEL